MAGISREAPLGLAVIASEGSHLAFGSAVASLDGVRPVALLDPGEEFMAVRAWHRQVGRCRVHRSLEELLEDEAVAAVLVLSRPEDRSSHASAVVRSGKHCLVAAPVCRESARCALLAHDADGSGAVLVPGMLLRYEPAVLRADEALRTGEIGEPRQLRCEWTFSAAWDERAWPSAMVHHALETLDLSRWWLGEVLAVSADLDVRGQGGVVTPMANFILQHERGVSVHHLHQTSGTPRHERYILAGSDGALELTGPASGVIERAGGLRVSLRHAADESVPLEVPLAHASSARSHVRAPFRNLLVDFVEAAAGRRQALVHMEDVEAALRVLEAAQVSSREGVKVQLPTVTHGALQSA